MKLTLSCEWISENWTIVLINLNSTEQFSEKIRESNMTSFCIWQAVFKIRFLISGVINVCEISETLSGTNACPKDIIPLTTWAMAAAVMGNNHAVMIHGLLGYHQTMPAGVILPFINLKN